MLPLLLGAALASSPPPVCPADLLVANPRLKVVRGIDRAADNYVITVDVRNRGSGAQPVGTEQHLELFRDGRQIGAQPIPPLGRDESYAAAFRIVIPHVAKRPPLTVEFRYVLDSKNAPRANCTTANDRMTATL